MKLSHAALIFISGMVWLGVGCFLLPFGLHLMMAGAEGAGQGNYYPLLSFLSSYTGSAEQAALLLIVICLFIGYLKGKKVLAKSVHRSVRRIEGFANPTSITKIYSGAYYLLFASMIGLGFLIKFFGLSHDVRGAVDIAVGAALINGAVLYFKEARKQQLKTIN